MFRLRRIYAAGAVALAAVSTIIVVLAYLTNQEYSPYCGYCTALGVTKVTFGAAQGQVTFALSNNSGQDITIIQVGLGPLNAYNDTVSPNTTIHPVSNITLIVTFPNIIFQTGRNYSFTFVLSQGVAVSITTTR